MRALSVLLGVLLLSVLADCTAANPARYGRARVAVQACPDPQGRWLRDAIPGLNVFAGPMWEALPAGSTATADVTVRCTAFPDSEPALGRYSVGNAFVEVDPYRIPDVFRAEMVVRHELVHWFLTSRGPNPARGGLHVCPLGDNRPAERQRADCWPERRASPAMMSPTESGFSTSRETIDVGFLAQNEPTLADLDFFTWALSP